MRHQDLCRGARQPRRWPLAPLARMGHGVLSAVLLLLRLNVSLWPCLTDVRLVQDFIVNEIDAHGRVVRLLDSEISSIIDEDDTPADGDALPLMREEEGGGRQAGQDGKKRQRLHLPKELLKVLE